MKRINVLKSLILFTFLALKSFADSGASFSPYVETTFPVSVSVGGNVIFNDAFSFGLGFGVLPSTYSAAIGAFTAEYGNKNAYKDLVEAAFHDNSLIRVHGSYFFKNAKSGWSVGMAYDHINTSGTADVDTVLEATTGNDFTNLKNLLIAAGRSTDVDLSGRMHILELWLARTSEVSKNLSLVCSFGLAKIIAADTEISTGLKNFESSASGATLLSDTEKDLDKILVNYGVSPTLGLSVNYIF
jgi:hypothetical protein